MNKNLGLLLSGQLVSQIGDKFHMLAVSFLFSAENESLILFGSVFLIGVSLLLIGGLHVAGFRLILPYLGIFQVTGGLIILAGTSFRSMIQKEVEDRMMGRVFEFVSSGGNST